MNNFLDEYEKLPDEELVELSAGGDKAATECILARYKNLVRARGRMYFLAGADREDIIQEGMIGLFKAIRDFDSAKLASFRGFAELCIKRQILTAVKNANRQKHIPLNSYISLSAPFFDEDSENIVEELVSDNMESNPENLIIRKEKAASMSGKIDESLSTLEKKVLSLYLSGKNYQEIAEILGRSPKSADNALQRIKKKVEKLAQSDDQYPQTLE